MRTLMLLTLGLVTVLGTATTAQADQVSVTNEDSGRIVRLSGRWGGVTSEFFEVLDLSGVQPTPITEGRMLRGGDLAAHFLKFAPTASFDATLQIDTNSDVELGDRTVEVTGEAAAELYSDMAKAGIPKQQGVDGNSLIGTHITCTMLCLGHPRYSCSLRASD